MVRLHYFNPGHETAVFQGKVNFTPTRNVRKMLLDLAFLPAWYANPGDYILMEDSIPDLFRDSIPAEIKPAVFPVTAADLKNRPSFSHTLKASPWGLSPQSIYRMTQIKEEAGIPLEIPGWDKQYYDLTGRQTAATCLEQLKKELPHIFLPVIPSFFKKLEEIENYLLLQKEGSIIKTPYSSSGRGLLWITGNILTKKESEWISGAIKKQGSVSIEPALKKVRDFGLEFLSDGKGNVCYKGISPFETNEKGSFLGNSIYPQERIMEEIFQLFSSSTYEKILTTLTGILQEKYGSIYEGCIGVDSMLYLDASGQYQFHPCVEINMRYTMGYLSLQLQKILHPESKGVYQVTYSPSSTTCFDEHQQMAKAYPLQLKDGKIKEGYLSLCPVTPETNYKATLLVL